MQHINESSGNDMELIGLAGFSDDEWQQFISLSSVCDLAAGDILLEEGAMADALFFIEGGTVQVSKIDAGTQQSHVLNHLGQGDIAGELGLFDPHANQRSASLTALVPTRVRKIPYAALNTQPALKQKLNAIVIRQLSKRLGAGNHTAITAMQNQLEEQAKRQALGVFVVRSLYVITVYTLGVSVLKQLQVPSQWMNWLSFPLILVVAITVAYGMRATGYPLRQFGLHFDHWRRYCWQATGFTLPVMGVILLGKYLLITHHPEYAEQALIAPFAEFTRHGSTYLMAYGLSFLLYTLLCPLQELIARGGLQAPLTHFLSGSTHQRNWNAIVLSNLVFALMHIHLSVWLALLTVVLGIFWGWIYARQRSLVGVVWSHWLIGAWGIYVMGNPFSL